MKNWRTLLLLPLIGCVAFGMIAAGEKTEDDLKRICEGCLTKMVEGEAQAAIDLLKPYWHSGPDQMNSIAEARIKQASTLQSRYGEALGYALIRTEKAGDCLVRFSYLEKREFYCMIWQFAFYRGSKGWKLVTAHYGDKIDDMFKP